MICYNQDKSNRYGATVELTPIPSRSVPSLNPNVRSEK